MLKFSFENYIIEKSDTVMFHPYEMPYHNIFGDNSASILLWCPRKMEALYVLWIVIHRITASLLKCWCSEVMNILIGKGAF